MHPLVWLVLVGLIYYFAARLSLRFALVEENITPLWPPTGIAVGAFLTLGYRVWPAIALAAFFVNLPISPSSLVAVAIAVGNTAAPIASTGLLRRMDFRASFDRLQDAVAILLAALIGNMVSASVGTTALWAFEAIGPMDFLQSWMVWWTGDAMGVLVVAPALLTVRSMPSLRLPWRRLVETVLSAGALVGGCVLLLTTSVPVWVALFPVLALIAVRYRLPGAAVAALGVSSVAAIGAAQNVGVFGSADLVGTMLGLQTFNAAVSFTTLFLATSETERTRAHEDLEGTAVDLRQTVERRTAIARTLQRSMLPRQLPESSDIEIAARYVPATGDVEIGGDWYDAVKMPSGELALAIGDVAGHGVRAAATMGQMRMALRAYALESLGPTVALEHLNSMLQDVQPGSITTLLYLQLDPQSGNFRYANAGHPPALVLSSNEHGFAVEALGPPLGAVANVTYYEGSGKLDMGDTLVLYTDGLIERRRASIDDGLDRLVAAASEAPTDLEEACVYITDQLLSERLDDDVALVVVRRIALSTRRLELRRPAVPASVPEIRRTLTTWLWENDAGPEAFDMVVACSEACTNVIQHAYGPGGGPLHVDGEVREGEVTVHVSDHGMWRQPRRSEGGEELGRGLRMMRALMDEVDVDCRPDGTRVSLRLKLGSPHNA